MAPSALNPATRVVIYPSGQQVLPTPSAPVATASNMTAITTPPPSAAVPDEPIKVQGGLREYESTRQAP